MAALTLSAVSTSAQQPPPSVSLGFGVDSTAPDVGGIVRLVREYLARPDSSAASRGLWSTAHPLDRSAGDVTRSAVYQGFPATVVGVLSAGPGDSVYVVKVLHASADGSRRRITPIALQRLYAVRAHDAPHGWQLANALPRLTGSWPTRTAGRITFHYAPGQSPSDERAAEAARFVDSVATLFDVPAPRELHYYVAASPDEYYRALGLDFYVLPSGRGTSTGGNAMAAAGIVLAGDPRQGEAYLHELVHAVLGDHLGGGAFASEGVATWLGGSGARGLPELARSLVAYQQRRTDVTLDALVAGDVPGGWGNAETDALYASSALFVDAVFRRDGRSGVRSLRAMADAQDAIIPEVRRRLGLPADDPAALGRWWRDAAAAAARRP